MIGEGKTVMTVQALSRKISLLLGTGVAIAAGVGFSLLSPPVAKVAAQNANALTVRSDIQEANTETGVITARGNVRINYPARNLQATAAQAQYFSTERKLVLSGNVYVLQDGNSLRAEQMVYSIDEGRFLATPARSEQVEATYLLQEEPKPKPPAIALPQDSEQ